MSYGCDVTGGACTSVAQYNNCIVCVMAIIRNDRISAIGVNIRRLCDRNVTLRLTPDGNERAPAPALRRTPPHCNTALYALQF